MNLRKTVKIPTHTFNSLLGESRNIGCAADFILLCYYFPHKRFNAPLYAQKSNKHINTVYRQINKFIEIGVVEKRGNNYHILSKKEMIKKFSYNGKQVYFNFTENPKLEHKGILKNLIRSIFVLNNLKSQMKRVVSKRNICTISNQIGKDTTFVTSKQVRCVNAYKKKNNIDCIETELNIDDLQLSNRKIGEITGRKHSRDAREVKNAIVALGLVKSVDRRAEILLNGKTITEEQFKEAIKHEAIPPYARYDRNRGIATADIASRFVLHDEDIVKASQHQGKLAGDAIKGWKYRTNGFIKRNELIINNFCKFRNFSPSYIINTCIYTVYSSISSNTILYNNSINIKEPIEG